MRSHTARAYHSSLYHMSLVIYVLKTNGGGNNILMRNLQANMNQIGGHSYRYGSLVIASCLIFSNTCFI